MWARYTSAVLALIYAIFLITINWSLAYYNNKLGQPLFDWSSAVDGVVVVGLTLGAVMAFRRQLYYLIATWAVMVCLSLWQLVAMKRPVLHLPMHHPTPAMVAEFQRLNEATWHTALAIATVILAFKLTGFGVALYSEARRRRAIAF